MTERFMLDDASANDVPMSYLNVTFCVGTSGSLQIRKRFVKNLSLFAWDLIQRRRVSPSRRRNIFSMNTNNTSN